MFEVMRVLFVVCCVVFVDSKACGRCDCQMTTVKPPLTTIAKDVLIVNCSDSGIAKTVKFPDVSSFTFSEIELEASRNKLESVKLFAGDPITKIDLSQNEIRRIDQESFVKMSKLLELDLSHNKLKEADLSVETFKGLKNLQKLSLYNTAILRLKPTVFSEMKALKDLNLGRNFLEGKLDPELFNPLVNLRVLSLAENNLQSIHPDSFLKMSYLEFLNVSGNSIKEFDDSLLMNSLDIRVLDLSKNKLEMISTELFKYLSKLEVLNLGYNKFAQFDADMFLGKSLRVLDVGHNELKTVKFLEKNDLENLQEVYLQDNLLTDVDFIEKFATIRILNVSSNQLSSFPQTPQPQLTTLDLSNNTFQTIPDIVNAADLPSLSHLHLDYNPISDLHLPTSLQPFTSLTFISISNMPVLTTITSNAFQSLTTSRLVKRDTGDDGFHKFVNEDYEMDDGGVVDEEPEASKEDAVDPKTGDYEVEKKEEPVEKESIEEENEFEGDLDERMDERDEDKEKDVTVKVETTKLEDTDAKVGSSESKSKEDQEEVVQEPSPDKEEDTPSPDKEEDEPNQDKEEQEPRQDKEEEEPSPDKEEDEPNEDKEEEEPSPDKEDEQEVRRPSPRLLPSGDDKEVVKDPASEDKPRIMDQLAGDAARRKPTTPAQKMVEDDCIRGGLRMTISRNKNMDTIEAGAFTGINLCMLDLSGNSLTTIPEAMVTWSEVPYIDLQFNPWDCSCQQQWLLDTIVPKLYNKKPELLYELRCGSPALLVNRRFVHYYNWSEKAFCVEHNSRMMNAPEVDDEVGVVLKLGDSSGTIAIIAVCCGIVVLLVAVGIFLQWRMTLRRRNRNRRL